MIILAFTKWLANKIKQLSKSKKRTTKQIRPSKRANRVRGLKEPLSLSNSNPQTITKVVDSEAAVTKPIITTKITVAFLDEQHHLLKPTEILVGNSGEPVKFTVPQFDNYFLTTIDNFTTVFLDHDQEISFHFALKNAAPVQIYCLDFDSHKNLRKLDLVRGKLGQTYEIKAPKISNYRLLNSFGATYGIFTRRAKQVAFYYRIQNWQVVHQVKYYVRLLTEHPTYDFPDGQVLGAVIPKTAEVKVFTKIVTTEGQEWLNVGGFQWINQQATVQIDAPTKPTIKAITTTSAVKTNLSGIVEYIADHQVTTFTKPYGEPQSHLNHLQPVRITQIIKDDQNIQWYQLTDNSVVPARYIRLNKS